jgi:hypothetical protein
MNEVFLSSKKENQVKYLNYISLKFVSLLQYKNCCNSLSITVYIRVMS